MKIYEDKDTNLHQSQSSQSNLSCFPQELQAFCDPLSSFPSQKAANTRQFYSEFLVFQQKIQYILHELFQSLLRFVLMIVLPLKEYFCIILHLNFWINIVIT